MARVVEKILWQVCSRVHFKNNKQTIFINPTYQKNKTDRLTAKQKLLSQHNQKAKCFLRARLQRLFLGHPASWQAKRKKSINNNGDLQRVCRQVKAKRQNI